MDIEGFWYDGKQSGQQSAVVRIDQQGRIDVLAIESQDASSVTYAPRKLFSGLFSTVDVSSRLGNSNRYLYFPAGQKLETRDNDSIDQAVSLFQPHKKQTLLYRLETHWRYVVTALVLMIALVAWTAMYGVPLVAKQIATLLPSSLFDKAGEQTLALLDKQMMHPSALDTLTQERVRDHFNGILKQHPELHLQVLFRSSDIGPNAFALPDGSIIFTDDIIRLAENDDELLSVMAHEVGHVVHQHGMRSVIQGSMVGFVLMLMTGDVSATSEWFLGIPVILTQLGYSRRFEREADDYALSYMQANNIDTAHFSRLMSRIEALHCNDTPPNAGDDGDQEAHQPSCPQEVSWQGYLSTHPGLQERIEKFSRRSGNAAATQ